MKGIQIVSSNESIFLQAAQIMKVHVEKLARIQVSGFVFYRVVAPYSQQDIFYLGIVYERLLLSYSPMPF